MEKSLRINLGSNYQLIVEEDEQRINASPFKHVYSKAFELVEEIVNNGESYKNVNTSASIRDIPYTYNNIIAFTGDRGVGKTSAMVTFANMLKNRIGPVQGTDEFETNIKFKEKSYYLTKVVDPALFNQNSNIMEVVISHLFANLVAELKKTENQVNEQGKHSVISAFETVFKAIRTTIKSKSEIYNDDAVDALISLSSASDLQKHINDLIRELLKFVNKDFLVIQIDDIDLHTKQAHEMAEMLRKYLTQPNIIVLMALNPIQLEEVVYQQFLNDYKSVIDIIKSDESQLERKISEIRSMTTRYMEKFLPADRRVQLPTLQELSVDSSVILYKKNGKENDPVPYCQRERLDQLIMELIYIKTGLITYETEQDTYLFLPRNLREFIYLVEKLCNMKTVINTSFVQALKIRKSLNLGDDLDTTDSLLNSDGMAIRITNYLGDIKALNNDKHDKIICTTHKMLALNGLLKLRVETKEEWDADILSIQKRIGTDIEEMKTFVTKINKTIVYQKNPNSALVNGDFMTYDMFKKNITENKNTHFQISQCIEFKRIFINWCKDNLTSHNSQIIDGFFEARTEQMNKFIVGNLAEIINKSVIKYVPVERESDQIILEFELENSEEDFSEQDETSLSDNYDSSSDELTKIFNYDEYQRIISPANNPENISYGDVNYLLIVFKLFNSSRESACFIYAVKMAYNILLLEYQLKKPLNSLSDGARLLGGSFYNPVSQKIIKSRSSIPKITNVSINSLDMYKNRSIAFIESKVVKNSAPLLLMQIRDFEPATKTRTVTKAGLENVEFLVKYFERYRVMNDVYVKLNSPNRNKTTIFDAMAFLYNLHRVQEFVDTKWFEVGNFVNDISDDYKQLLNVGIMSYIFKATDELRKLDFDTKSEYEYYKEFLIQLKVKVKSDYLWIDYNSFEDLNYLKKLSDIKLNYTLVIYPALLVVDNKYKREHDQAIQETFKGLKVMIKDHTHNGDINIDNFIQSLNKIKINSKSKLNELIGNIQKNNTWSIGRLSQLESEYPFVKDVLNSAQEFAIAIQNDLDNQTITRHQWNGLRTKIRNQVIDVLTLKDDK